MENPNAYDDDKWTDGSMRLRSAVGRFWEAGCDLEHIEQDVAGALEDDDAFEGKTIDVSITVT